MAAVDLMVYHRDDECLQSRQGERNSSDSPSQHQLIKLRFCSNGVKPVALRKTCPWSDWTSAFTIVSSTTSRKAETVGFHLQQDIASH
jgi:hypothetical protein